MDDIEQVKSRLIREAIQDNIHRDRRRPSRKAVRARRAVPHWLWGVTLLATLVYIAVPPELVWTAETASGLVSTEPAETLRDSADQPAAPGPAEAPDSPPPQPLDRALFPLSVGKIVLDPGHGGFQHGAISESGVSEKTITLDIALRLRRLLEEESFEVLMTRETDQHVTLERRTEFAAAGGADLFVSVHINWIEPRQLRSVETYFLGPSDDPATTRLVAMEDHDAGYSLGDYRWLMERIYMDTRRDESRKLAHAVQGELYRSLNEINPALDDRGVKMAPFAVLVRTEMPAILVEVSCLSNEDEVKLLTTSEYRENIAQALLSGIRSYANKLNGPGGRVNYGRNE